MICFLFSCLGTLLFEPPALDRLSCLALFRAECGLVDGWMNLLCSSCLLLLDIVFCLCWNQAGLVLNHNPCRDSRHQLGEKRGVVLWRIIETNRYTEQLHAQICVGWVSSLLAGWIWVDGCLYSVSSLQWIYSLSLPLCVYHSPHSPESRLWERIVGDKTQFFTQHTDLNRMKKEIRLVEAIGGY